MKQKKLMLLGGIRYLLPVIKAAHEKGYYVITCDYLPDNIAHKYSDEYVNVSIVDKEAVLAVAKEKKIDGIMSFGVDPGVVSASYVQNQLHLPSFGPYESVVILQNKDKFRAFLRDNGFNVPKSK
ncbi:MAG: carboxylate--amine ligase, partial [Prevotella bivia]|nr:carboxylate--amine ligase [Prevotella bivia]